MFRWACKTDVGGVLRTGVCSVPSADTDFLSYYWYSRSGGSPAHVDSPIPITLCVPCDHGPPLRPVYAVPGLSRVGNPCCSKGWVAYAATPNTRISCSPAAWSGCSGSWLQILSKGPRRDGERSYLLGNSCVTFSPRVAFLFTSPSGNRAYQRLLLASLKNEVTLLWSAAAGNGLFSCKKEKKDTTSTSQLTLVEVPISTVG